MSGGVSFCASHLLALFLVCFDSSTLPTDEDEVLNTNCILFFIQSLIFALKQLENFRLIVEGTFVLFTFALILGKIK